MIVSSFFVRAGSITGFRVAGHAGYAQSGSDIVCSAVSAVTHMTALGIIETMALDAHAEVDEANGSMFFEVEASSVAHAQAFLQTLRSELQTIQKQYPDCLKVRSIGDPS